MTPTIATPEVQNIYVMLDTNHQPLLFRDPEGKDELKNEQLPLLYEPAQFSTAAKHGRLFFHFIRCPTSPHSNIIETADLVIIAQTGENPADPRSRQKSSPFHKHDEIVYLLPDPAGGTDPGNLKGTLPGVGGVVSGIKFLRVRDNPSIGWVYKYSIVALCDGQTIVRLVDPTVIIKNQ